MANTHSIDFERDSSQYCTVPRAAALEPTSITIEAWIKPESDVNGIIYQHPQADSGSNNATYHLQRDAAGTITCYFQNTTSSVSITSVSTVASGGWTHVAVTYDGTTANIYLNGNSTADKTLTLSQAIRYNGTLNFCIGAALNESGNPVAGYYFDGLVDDLRVYNAVRTGANIASDYNQELVGDEANLILYAKFNNNLTDSGPGGYTITGANSPTYSTDVPFGAVTTTSNGDFYFM